MTVESNNVIAIDTLSDWFKRLAPVFQFPTNEKQNQNQSHHVRVIFFRTLSELHVIARNCDWFISLAAPVVIGRSTCLGFGFSRVT